MAARDLSQPLEEAGLGRDEALERLDDDGGQLVGVRGDDALDRAEIVERRDQHFGLERVRDARRVGHGSGEGLGRARRRAHHGIVVGAVVAALELEDLVALAIRARDAEREEGRLRAGGGEAHLLGARHRLADLLGQLDDGLVDHEVRAAALDLLAHRGDHRRMRVAEDERAGGQDVVDVLAPAHVVDLRALAVLDDEGGLLRVAGGAQHAAGQAPLGVLQELGFAGGSGSGRLSHGLPPLGGHILYHSTYLRWLADVSAMAGASAIMPAMFLIGIDVGGTFTDLTAIDEATGRVVVTKVPSRAAPRGGRRPRRPRGPRHREPRRAARGPRHHGGHQRGARAARRARRRPHHRGLSRPHRDRPHQAQYPRALRADLRAAQARRRPQAAASR